MLVRKIRVTEKANSEGREFKAKGPNPTAENAQRCNTSSAVEL